MVLRGVCGEIGDECEGEEEVGGGAVGADADYFCHGVSDFGGAWYVHFPLILPFTRHLFPLSTFVLHYSSSTPDAASKKDTNVATLPILAIFAILQFTTSVPAISTNVLTTVVIFLPLSSLWASATVTASSSRNQLPSSSYNSNNTRTSSNTFGTLGSSASTQVSKHIGGGTYLKNKFLAFGGSSGGFHIPASSSPGGGPILIGTHGYGNGLAAGFGGTGGYLGNSNSTENEGNDGLRSGWLSPGSNISMQDHHNGNVANAVDRDLEAQGLDAGVVGGGERKG